MSPHRFSAAILPQMVVLANKWLLFRNSVYQTIVISPLECG
jgi:hypothetical protein